MHLFWRKQRRGANGFNRTVTRDWWRAAHQAGIEWVRLAPDKWDKAAGQRDFLIGNADSFSGLNTVDMKDLIRCLDNAAHEKVSVVLTLLSLPGARWRQHNGDQSDPRLWREEHFVRASERCWQELARQLKGHPALVGYDPLNEPHPARALKKLSAGSPAYRRWVKETRGTLADVNVFNRRMVAAIRKEDTSRPILVESGDFASSSAFEDLHPVEDADVLYSFHLYDPWEFTASKEGRGKLRYPETMPEGWNGMEGALEPIDIWAKAHGIPASRIVAAEYGCHRQALGADRWLQDATSALDKRGWHRAFYSFREDTWDGMDYELGSGPLPASYGKTVEAGKTPVLPRRTRTPHWQALKMKP